MWVCLSLFWELVVKNILKQTMRSSDIILIQGSRLYGKEERCDIRSNNYIKHEKVCFIRYSNTEE